MADLLGLCSICGKPNAMYTCHLCGKLACIQCYDSSNQVCIQCKRTLP
ncbi:MAG: orotate phosphoribosyltransferase [Thermoplasmatota archaeon]